MKTTQAQCTRLEDLHLNDDNPITNYRKRVKALDDQVQRQKQATLPEWIASANPQVVNHRLRQFLEKIVLFSSGKITLEFK